MPSTTSKSRPLPVLAARTLAGVAFLALFLTPAHGTEERTPQPTPLGKLHARVERAFGRCDATMLRPLLSSSSKTFVDAEALAPSEGYYGPDQLLLLFERLFEGRTTVSFTALSTDPKPRRDGRAALPIRWVSRSSDRSQSEISFSLILATESSSWRIREIRDLK